MMPNRGVGGLFVLLVILVILVAAPGCATTSSGQEAGRSPARSGGTASAVTTVNGVQGLLPPPRPCSFPSTERDLLGLRADSDAVVDGTVAASPKIVSAQDLLMSYYRVRVNGVIEARSAVGGALVVAAAGGVPNPILPPGRYVLFLTRDITRPEPGERTATFGLVGGLDGAFPVRNSRVYRECADPANPGRRVVASGAKQGMSLSAFVTTMIKAGAQPARARAGRTGG